MKSFISIGDAAAMLLGAGLQVSLSKRKPEGWASDQTWIMANGQSVAGGFKDGATWKFKAETVQHFVDDYELAKAKQAKQGDAGPKLFGFGKYPDAKSQGYGVLEKTIISTQAGAYEIYAGQDVALVVGASCGVDMFEYYVFRKYFEGVDAK